MRKVGFWFLLLTLTLTAIFAIRNFGYFTFYIIPSPSMEPGLPVGTYFFASRFFTPGHYDRICFRSKKDNMIYISRMVADEGDTLQIKDGLVFINNKLSDDSAQLKFFYSTGDSSLISVYQQFSASLINDFQYGSFLALSQDEYIKLSHKVSLTRFIWPHGIDQENVFDDDKSKHWNIDQLGPYVIPKGKCFVIGDNRHNSWDSRFYGPVDKETIIGVMKFHFSLPS